MKHHTPYGVVKVLDLNSTFNELLSSILEASSDNAPLVLLSGGSTPKAFYNWVISHNKLEAKIAQKCIWSTSDERFVDSNSQDSNFGNASRLLLDPLHVSAAHKMPMVIDTKKTPEENANHYNQSIAQLLLRKKAIDLCILGMGEDAHIASIFPDSSLLKKADTSLFTALDVPQKGPRLTITPAGLNLCKHIVIIVNGKNKKEALLSVFKEDKPATEKPAKLLKNYAQKTTWLIDIDAAQNIF